jgi:hypothetical protein
MKFRWITTQRSWTLLLSIALIGMWHCVPGWAQTATGTITGTVTDSGGSVVPSAQIVVQDRATGLTYKAQAGQDGSYVVPYLPIGDYGITVTAPGFESFHQTSATLDVSQRLRVDVTLAVGSVNQTVTVTSAEPTLQTEESSLGNVMEGHTIEELPLNGRQPFTLVLLVAGVQATNTGANGFADPANQDFSRLKMNGGPESGNIFLLDGAMDNIPTINEVSVIPMVDALAEFRALTGTLPAEYDQTSGGVMNIATKTGTNALHGTAYEFVRNDALNAVNRFATVPNPVTGRVKPILRYNQYGGTAGGPVRIPKIYNGHDRTFFFFGYEQWQERSSSLGYASVPTALQRSGDFSQTFTSTGALIPIYDPATTASNPAGNGFVRTQFPGNKIPADRMDSLALSVLKYMPMPNFKPTNAFTNANNWFYEPEGGVDDAVLVVRGDHRFSATDSIFARFATDLYLTDTVGDGLGDADPAARNDTRKNYNLAVGETHTFSLSVLNEFMASFVRQKLTFIAPCVGGNWPQKLGFPSLIPDTEFPSEQISGMLSLGESTGTFTDGDRIGTVIQFADSLTWVKGRHTLKFGFEDHVSRYNQQGQIYPSGEFSFSGAQTENPLVPAGTGVGMADYLLGQVGSGQLTINPAFSVESWAGGVYGQDDFKLKHNLTFNIGIRYNLFGPPVERHNWFSTFNPQVINPQTGMLGEMVYAGVTAPKSFVQYGYPYVAPRLGFAYSPNSRIVVRGGAGIIYNPVESADIHQVSNDAIGFSATNTFSSSGPYDAFQFSTGPSALTPPIGAAGGPTAYRGQSVYWQNHDAPIPYELQWNLAVQRELPGHWTGSAAYVGSHGVRLLGGNYSYNQLNPTYWKTYGSLLQNQVPNPFYGQILTGPLSDRTISQSQVLLPLPDYQSITTLARHGDDSIYHSLQATAEHRYAHGLTALVSYTKGKLIDSTSSNDSGESADGGYRIGRYNPRLDRSLDPTDVSQNLAVNGVWQLPFGENSHGLRYLALGGWQLNGLIAWQTGFPLTITGTNNFTGTPYPNVVGSPTLAASKRSVHEWFNVGAFANPANYTLGNASRSLPATRAPNYTNANTSLTKNFRLPENAVLQFRAEVFNVFNHPQLGTPNESFSPNSSGVNTSSTFGTITSALDPRDIQLGLHLNW